MLRCSQNPLITVSDVRPSRPDFHVEGIFNCGACRFQNQIFLVCRVAESAGCTKDEVRIPYMKKCGNRLQMNIISLVKREHPELNFSDSRKVGKMHAGVWKTLYLTSFSHLRLARSTDGIHFKVDEKPMLLPEGEEESWGMEDPRITQIGDSYYINYTAVSPQGPATALIRTQDFQNFERLGVIFAPENKDVVIFPQKINGLYYALNRPVSFEFGMPAMWICESPDLIHWGRQRKFFAGAPTGWDSDRVGGGAVPLLTEKGWIEFYHAADAENRYCLGAMLLDRDCPGKILARTKEPLLEPEAEYEKNGFFGNTVFTCGCIQIENRIILYYGAADNKICRVDFTLDEIFRALKI
ncbi:MAG TPA: glycosidase [Ruminococcaceae bacterium]|mgnify:FL=1|jgi:predicted GH43/DUF377 family glycosyl hydrolase|nr:glycosidase [Oscillospiraceae bacterium]HCM24285.1 glycosidase [Oscillospiraceae bacterium]